MTATAATSGNASAPAARLWGGRFAAEPAAEMDRLNRSLPVDLRLWREDVAGSQAWASAIAVAGVISHAEWLQLQAGLDRVATRLDGWKRPCASSSARSWSRRRRTAAR